MTGREDPTHRYHLAWANALTAALNAVRRVRGLPIDADLEDECAIADALAAGLASMTTDIQTMTLDPYLVHRYAQFELTETVAGKASTTFT